MRLPIHSITNLSKQQLYVVKSSLGAINDTLSDMEYEAKVREGLLQVKNYIELVTSKTKHVTDVLSAKITIESHIAHVKEALNYVQRSLDILIDSIVNARKGILQPQVVPPSLLIEALIKSSPSFPKETITPFPLSKDSTNILYKLCDVHVYISDNILGYVITLHLVSIGTFKILTMIPIPVVVENNKFVYINTDESILGLDQTRQYYFMLSEEELRNCKTTVAGSFICKQNHPLMSSHARESCAVKMLQPRRTIIPRSCETRVVELKSTVWIQLVNNQWIYFAPYADTVTILCNEKEPVDITLQGIGKLHINSGCKGYSTSALLQTSFTVVSNSSLKEGDLLTQIPLQYDCCEELGIKYNISNLSIDMNF